MKQPTSEASADFDQSPRPEKSPCREARHLRGLGGIPAAVVIIAYLVAPLLWLRYEDRHPALDDLPGITETGDHHLGDPINVLLIGSEADLQHIMLAAGWYPADPITLRSSLKIALGTVLHRQYDDAPVSSLYLWGRKQDLAFEMPVGNSPRQRHHVRFWKSARVDSQGRPAWAGSATFDKSVGLSHATGQITHHIAADVDAERDHLMQTLQQTGDLTAKQVIANFHQVRSGRNGGNDPWHTDGNLDVGTLAPLSAAQAKLPARTEKASPE